MKMILFLDIFDLLVYAYYKRLKMDNLTGVPPKINSKKV